jgi:glycyl-tRNA synthetase beta chain
MAAVIKGNERVLKARLSDALFFWENDLAKRLNPEPLKNIVFAHGLGSVYDKSMREAEIAQELGVSWGVKNIEDIKTAMHLAKADLLSDVVGEFGELQGIIGRYYAKNDGYSDEIATAIMEHYLPKGEDSQLPSSIFSATCAIASKFDSMLALFSVNMIPTGSKDPFALRRAGFGIIRIAMEFNLSFDISVIIKKFSHLYKPFDTSKLEEFLLDRIYQLFGEINSSIVSSVIASGDRDIISIAKKVEALDILSKRDGFRDNFSTFKRVANISKDFDIGAIGTVDTTVFENHFERALYEKFENCKNQSGSYFDELHRLFDLKHELDLFFDNCMVNADDLKIRENRKNLIAGIYNSFRKIADIKEISF